MSSVLTRRRTVPPTVRRVLWIVCGVVVGLLALSYVAGLFLQARAVHEARKLTLFDDNFHPPESTITCRTTVTTDCVDEAARRIRIPAAWMAVPAGYRLRWVMAAGNPKSEPSHRIAEEMLTGGRYDLELSTQPPGPWQPGNEQLVGTYTANGDVVSAYRDRPQGRDFVFPGITYRWTHDGVQYQLWVAPHYMLDTEPIDPGAYAPLVANVRYAEPPGHGGRRH
jgi:hypothetical protein